MKMKDYLASLEANPKAVYETRKGDNRASVLYTANPNYTDKQGNSVRCDKSREAHMTNVRVSSRDGEVTTDHQTIVMSKIAGIYADTFEQAIAKRLEEWKVIAIARAAEQAQRQTELALRKHNEAANAGRRDSMMNGLMGITQFGKFGVSLDYDTGFMVLKLDEQTVTALLAVLNPEEWTRTAK